MKKMIFVRCKLRHNWSCLYDRHGDGSRIRFPVKMRTFLAQSPKHIEGTIMLLLRRQELTLKKNECVVLV